MLTYLIPAGIAVFLLATIGLIFTRLYKRSNKEISFVRTGFGGEKTIMNGGAVVLPVLHETIDVNMKTLKLQVENVKKDSLLTADKLRVDIIAQFYIRVSPNTDAISRAAQTLGHKTLKINELKELIEGKFIDALRAVSISLTMESLLKERIDFVNQVQDVLAEDLVKNGLELENVSLTYFDQTSIEFYDPNNIMDAEGLTLITRQTEMRKKERNEITRDTELNIQQKDLETKEASLDLSQKEAEAEAQQIAKISEEESLRRQESENANILADQSIARAKIAKERILEEDNIARDKSIKIAEQVKSIQISEKSEEESAAKARANNARAEEVSSEEKIKTAREMEEANREKQLTLIKANEKAEELSIGIKVTASAEKAAASDRAESVTIIAKGNADAITIEAEANRIKYEVEAKGQLELNASENSLSPEIIAFKVQTALIENMPSIIEKVVAPMNNIDSIKIVDMGGVNGMVGNQSGSDNGSTETLPNQMVNAALRQTAMTPLIKEFADTIGMDFTTVDGMTAPLKGVLTSAQVEAPKAIETPKRSRVQEKKKVQGPKQDSKT